MRITARTSRRTTAVFCALVAATAAAASIGAEPAAAKNCHATKTCATTSTQPVTTSTGSGTTTTQPATTTTVQSSTTTTTIGGELAATYAGAFLSYPHQSGRQSITGNDLNVGMRSYVGFTAGACLTVHDAHNVYIHDVDFANCGGGIFLLNVTGTIRIEYIRGRNIGNGSIGSGQGNLIQFNNAWQSAPEIPGGYARVTHIKEYGGDTEDVISVFRSGGIDAAHPLVIGDVHVEHPLPPNALAWSSGSGTCANLADDGGHDIRLQNSTFLNCGAVGLQMNEPSARVIFKSNTVYGAQRATSNVGLSQWADTSCPGSCPGNSYTSNRVWWKNGSGGANPFWLSGTYPVADVNNTKQDATINPANLKVVL